MSTLRGERLAAIDVGTNTVLLTICECFEDGTREILFESNEVTRIGLGVDRTGRLDPRAEARTLSHFKKLREILDRHGVVATQAVGTSALRDAKGSEHFLEQAKNILGVPVEIIFGHREAELTFRGSTEELAPGQYFVFDIGGGSTELILGTKNGPLSLAESLPLGSVRLSERLTLSDPPQMGELEQLRATVREFLDELAPQFGTEQTCIGVAGTALTLAALDQAEGETELATLHGAVVRSQSVSNIVAKLAASTHSQRIHWGISEGRADVIVAGAILCEELLFWANATQMTVSNRGVRAGLIQALQASRFGK